MPFLSQVRVVVAPQEDGGGTARAIISGTAEEKDEGKAVAVRVEDTTTSGKAGPPAALAVVGAVAVAVAVAPAAVIVGRDAAEVSVTSSEATRGVLAACRAVPGAAPATAWKLARDSRQRPAPALPSPRSDRARQGRV